MEVLKLHQNVLLMSLNHLLSWPGSHLRLAPFLSKKSLEVSV